MIQIKHRRDAGATCFSMLDEQVKQRLLREHARLHRFWKTRRGLAYFRLGWEKFLRGIASDLRDKAPAAWSVPESGYDRPGTDDGHVRPVIYASYAVDELHPGSHRYCGGEKLLNNLVLLLRRNGFEAFMVTLDGKRAGWLIEPAPCVSLAEFQNRMEGDGNTRCVTSWIDARAFLGACGDFYYWDMELATSSDYQFPRIERLLRGGRVRNLAAFNRAIQAWFMEVFSRPCGLLRTLVDETHWKPAPEKRVAGRIGYMNEGPDTAALVERVRAAVARTGRAAEFVEVQGDEPDVLDAMQRCEVFLVTNPGKSPVWGEGGPMTPHEAMACGTVPVCFDLNGPREIVVDGYCGYIVPRDDHTAFAERVAGLVADPEHRVIMGKRAEEIVMASHTMEKRWPEVARFLELESLNSQI